MEKLIKQQPSCDAMDFRGWKGIGLFVMVLLVSMALVQGQNVSQNISSNQSLNSSVSNNNTILIPLGNTTGTAARSNVSKPVGKPSTAAIVNAALSQNCVNTYECLESSPGENYFGCYFDNATNGCRCFSGDISLCINKDNRCAFEHECQLSQVSEGYNYDCTYDKDAGQCRCFTGDFSLCRQKTADSTKILPPLPPKVDVPPINTSEQVIPPPVVVTPPSTASSLSLGIAAAAGVIILIALIIAFTLNRPTYDNLMRKARNSHQRAELMHEKGHEDDAKEQFAMAEALRKRALRMKKRSA